MRTTHLGSDARTSAISVRRLSQFQSFLSTRANSEGCSVGHITIKSSNSTTVWRQSAHPTCQASSPAQAVQRIFRCSQTPRHNRNRSHRRGSRSRVIGIDINRKMIDKMYDKKTKSPRHRNSMIVPVGFGRISSRWKSKQNQWLAAAFPFRCERITFQPFDSVPRGISKE